MSAEIAIYACFVYEFKCDLAAAAAPKIYWQRILANFSFAFGPAGLPAQHTFTLVDRVYCTPLHHTPIAAEAEAPAEAEAAACRFSTGYSGSSNAALELASL